MHQAWWDFKYLEIFQILDMNGARGRTLTITLYASGVVGF